MGSACSKMRFYPKFCKLMWDSGAGRLYAQPNYSARQPHKKSLWDGFCFFAFIAGKHTVLGGGGMIYKLKVPITIYLFFNLVFEPLRVQKKPLLLESLVKAAGKCRVSCRWLCI